MSEWQFHPNNDTNIPTPTEQINESGCNQQSFTPINKHYVTQSAPNTKQTFRSRPKIGRTPMVFNNLNNKENNNIEQIDPAMYTSYFIPNTPQILNNHFNEELQEPGSVNNMNKFNKKRRKSFTTLCQPEGTYSPIPKSKILSELNQSLSHLSIEQKQQSPLSMHSINSISLTSEKRINKIRNQVRAEIEKMDFQISQEMNDNFKLLNPSPATLHTSINKLKINNNNGNDYKQENKQEKNKQNNQKFVIQKQMVKTERKSSFCIDILWNSLNLIWILLILCLYWNIVDFQWS